MTRAKVLPVFGKMFPLVPPSKLGLHLLTSALFEKEVVLVDDNTDFEDVLARVIQRLLWELPENYPSRDHVERWLWQIHSDFAFELTCHKYSLD